MKEEFRLDDYGIKETEKKDITEICSKSEPVVSVLLLDKDTAVYLREKAFWKRSVSTGEEKQFMKSVGTSPKLVRRDSAIVMYNKEGAVCVFDLSGKKLRELCGEGTPIRSACFLTSTLVCVGGESCKLLVYSFAEVQPLFTRVFSDYIEHVASNGKYIAVSLSNGEVHVVSYRIEESSGGVSERYERIAMHVEDAGVIDTEKPATVHFVEMSRLFIGLSSGASYIYDVEEKSVACESIVHSKTITGVEMHGGFLVTSSLDGKLRISTKSLREVSSLHVGSPIISFSAVFGNVGDGREECAGSEYLISTQFGNVLLYRDAWVEKPADKIREERKSAPRTLLDHSKSASSIVDAITAVKTAPVIKRTKYERLVYRYEYIKSLSHAAQNGNRQALSSILEYLFNTDRHISSLCYLEDEDMAVVCDMCIDYVKDPEYFKVSASVLELCMRALLERKRAAESPLYPVLERALQETEEELQVQGASAVLREYLSTLILSISAGGSSDI